MEEYYLNKYQSKTKIELQRIVDNKDHYQPEAVIAASKLLNHRLDDELPQILSDSVNESKTENLWCLIRTSSTQFSHLEANLPTQKL